MPICASLRHDLRQISAEGQGLGQLIIINEAIVGVVADAAIGGDNDALAMLHAFHGVVQRMRGTDGASPSSAYCCMLCHGPRTDAPLAAVAIVSAYGDAARLLSSQGCCSTCVATQSEAELGAALVARLRAAAPDLRILPPLPPAGHA